MKKNFLFLMVSLLALTVSFSACSNDDDNDDYTAISYEKLPSETKQFITDHFVNYNVTEALESIDKYIVTLTEKQPKTTVNYGSYKIEFNRQGEWIKIEGRNDAILPNNVLALVPRSILSYVNQNYASRGITEIEKESYGCKIELTGTPEVELKFSYTGDYIGTDTGSDGAVITYDQLPQSAQTFLNTHFNGFTPSKIKKDNDSYDVDYANGTEVEFYLSGGWYKVEVEDKVQMPQTILTLLPKLIQDYISSNYSSKKIESIENKANVYEVELSGDIELIFDKEGNLWNSNGNTGSNGERLQLSALPQSIQSLLTEHFLAGTTFLYAEKDDDEYEVNLANGTEVNFSLNGELESVEVLPGNNVPDSVVLSAILSYVKTNYPNRKIEEYEKKAIGYKVELSGYPELELIFDSNGNFKKTD